LKPALLHLLTRGDWRATDPLDAYLPLDEGRAAWIGTDMSLLCAAVEVADMLGFDGPFLESLSNDLVRAANTLPEVEAALRACELTTALADAAFARTCAAVRGVPGKFKAPSTWGQCMAGANEDMVIALGRQPVRFEDAIGKLGVAARFGRLPLLQAAQARCRGFLTDWTVLEAARGGHLHVVRWLREQGCPWYANACAAAAGGGYLTLLQWLREQGCPWDATTCASAAEGGHLDVLAWARANGCPIIGRNVTEPLARRGDLDTLVWAWGEGAPLSSQTAADAALGGHIHVLEWLRAHIDVFEVPTWRSAAEEGHAHVLDWLVARGYTCPTRAVLQAAACRGRMPILEWARAQNPTFANWRFEMVALAAIGQHYEAVRWLLDAGCPWDAERMPSYYRREAEAVQALIA
jgi:hypothetical protein